MIKLETKRDKLIRRRNTLIDLLADGDITKTEYNEKVDIIRTDIDTMNTRIKVLKKAIDTNPTIDELTYLKSEFESIIHFDALTKDMLQLLVDKIEVNKKGEPVIFYKFAPAFKAVI